MKIINRMRIIGCVIGLTLATGVLSATGQQAPYPARPVAVSSANPASPEPGTREYYEQRIRGHYGLDGGKLVAIVSVRDLPPGLIRYTSAPGVSRRTSSGSSEATPAGARWIEGPVMQIVSNNVAVIGKAVTNSSGTVRIDPSCLVAMHEDRKSGAGDAGRFLAVSDGQYRFVAQSGVEGRLLAYREVSEPSFDDYVGIYQRDCQATVEPIISMGVTTNVAPSQGVRPPPMAISTGAPPPPALSPEEIQRNKEMRQRRDEERKAQAAELAKLTPEERTRRIHDLNVELILNNQLPPPIELDEKDIAKLKAAGFEIPNK